MESYFESQRDHIFRNVAVLIYVFDVESRQMKKDIQYFSMCIEALKANSDKSKVFCLVHKMDLVPADVRASVFAKQEGIVRDIVGELDVTCFQTSIWDETLYRAWSQIVYSLIPNVGVLEDKLGVFCGACGADEVLAGLPCACACVTLTYASVSVPACNHACTCVRASPCICWCMYACAASIQVLMCIRWLFSSGQHSSSSRTRLIEASPTCTVSRRCRISSSSSN